MILEHFEIFIGFFITPFLELLEFLGVENTSIKLGIGQVEFFDMALYDLTYIIGGFFVLILFYRILWRIFKGIVRLLSGGYLK